MAEFNLKSDYEPRGDQGRAIEELTDGLHRGDKHQTLLGVTGSGKTYTLANVIAHHGRPTLVISHNKTLGAQLYGEFKAFFPEAAVEYFVSYFDYYQPEAYMPTTDTYIEKDSSVNDDIDRMRLKATSSLLEREDVIIVASVSCIYGLGSPSEYKEMMLFLERGETVERQSILQKLVEIHYARNDVNFERGTFRVRGDVVEVHPAYEEFAYRIEMFGDEIERIEIINPITGQSISSKKTMELYPAVHYVMPEDRIALATESIQEELDQRLMELEDALVAAGAPWTPGGRVGGR